LQDDQLGFLKRLQRYDYFFFLPNIYETFFDFFLKRTPKKAKNSKIEHLV